MLLGIAVLAAPPPPRSRLGLVPSRMGVRGPVLLVCLAGVASALPPAVLLASSVLGVTLIVRRRRRHRRRDRHHAGHTLAGALETLAGELRVGAHPVQAFAIAAGESGGAIGSALRAVAARAGLGADVGAGLRALGGSTSVPAQWERLAVCWQLAADHGLAMAALIRTAQRDIVERQRFTARVEAGLAGVCDGTLPPEPLLDAIAQLTGMEPGQVRAHADVVLPELIADGFFS